MSVLDAASSREMLLIYVAKALRSFGLGIISVIFFENLYLKGVTQMMAGLMQVGIVFGDMIVTYLLTTRAARFGYVNSLLIGGLLKLLTGYFYVWYTNWIVLVVAGTIGVISATGGQIGPFAKIQTLFIISLTGSKQSTELKQRYLGYYNWIGNVAQALGCVFSGVFVMLQLSYFKNYEEDAIKYLFQIYFVICNILMLVYSRMDTQFLEKSSLNNQNELGACQCAKVGSKFKFILMLLSKFVSSVVSGFLALTFLSFYYYEKFQFQILIVGVLAGGLVLFNGLSGYLSQKMVKVMTPMSALLYLHVPFSLLLIFAAFTTKASTSLIIILAYFLTSKMNSPAKKIFESSLLTQSQLKSNKPLFSVIQSLGLMLGLGITGILMQYNPHIPGFSVPLIVGGGVNALLSLIIAVFLCACPPLDHAPSKPLQQVHSGEIIEKQQHQRLFSNESS